MYRVSQLMSTPVASSSRLEREYAGELSATCIFPSFACDFLDGDSSFECCSIDPLTGSHYTCRRSPRLLTNGYYIWTEDSFLCDKDGNITLHPSQTRVMYKENVVSASQSWLHGSFFGDVDSSPSEDVWLEGVRRVDTDHCNGNGGDVDCFSLTDAWEPEMPNAETAVTFSSSHVLSQPPREKSHNSSLQSPLMASEHFQENIWDYSKTSLLRELSFQAILLAVCLIIFACARWFMEGILARVFICSLLITIAYAMKSLFLSLASYFKGTTCVRLAEI
ncbi:PREDICTED: transmembrane protein 71 [Propithecus coquereli]|uniref:transmembrane protein 71 n=1 Tax=Propithecus coquereli TaxID=379532 RepID=UPI00063F20B5|nr:PREDICTED: transmembrane protein 71 [Propithecus coquereli]